MPKKPVHRSAASKYFIVVDILIARNSNIESVWQMLDDFSGYDFYYDKVAIF
jgi:hypothetical protein